MLRLLCPLPSRAWPSTRAEAMAFTAGSRAFALLAPMFCLLSYRV